MYFFLSDLRSITKFPTTCVICSYGRVLTEKIWQHNPQLLKIKQDSFFYLSIYLSRYWNNNNNE